MPRMLKSRRLVLSGTLAVLMAVVAAGCGPAADPTPPPATDTPQPPAQQATATPVPAGVEVRLADDAEFGPILTDADGMVLYLFTVDEPNVSNCTEGCLAAWPPLITEGDPVAGDGVDQSLLGVITRDDDGRQQVTYDGWPLYYWASDMAPGDTTGQGVNNVWWVVSPAGEAIMEAEVPVAADVTLIDDAEFGPILADADGMVLYLFTNDEPKVSNCTGGCLNAWPPLTVEDGPVAGDGVDQVLLGVITRDDDGSQQVTYNGWPLYYWASDMAPGDTTGQGVNNVWWVVSPAGEGIMEAETEAEPDPTPTPRPADDYGY